MFSLPIAQNENLSIPSRHLKIGCEVASPGRLKPNRRCQDHLVPRAPKRGIPPIHPHIRSDHSIVETGIKIESKSDLSLNTVQNPMDLGRSRPCISRVRAWHEIRSYYSRTVYAELGYENVGVFQISLGGMAFPDWCETPSAACPVAEYRREEAGRVESGQTTPINRSIIADKGHRPSVADDSICANLFVC